MNKSKNKAKSNNRRIVSPDAIEKFKNYLLSVNWEFTTNNDNNLDINAIYDDFLHVFNHGFNICFPKKSTVNYRKTPRKDPVDDLWPCKILRDKVCTL